MKRFVVILINIFLLGCSIAASVASSRLKIVIENVLKDQNLGQSETGQIILQYSLVVMNALIVELLNILYDQIYIQMTDYENYSDLKEFENSLILKRFTFRMINMFNSMVIISLFKSAFPLTFGVCSNFGLEAKGTTYCFIELRTQVLVFFCFSTFVEFLREIVRVLKYKFRNKRKKWLDKVKYDFSRIDKKIHSQSMKPDYETTNQIDGTSKDIMKYIIEYAYLSLLGFSAPIIFMLSLISNIIFLALAKFKMLYIYKRPIPQNAKDISPFNSMLNFIGTFSIISNAIVFSITLMGFEFEKLAEIQQKIENYSSLSETEQNDIRKTYNEEMHTNFIIFVIVLMVLMAVKFIFNAVFGDFSSEFKILSERHEQIRTRIFAMTTKTNLMFARAGVSTKVPESYEDQVNMLNKIKVWKGKPDEKKKPGAEPEGFSARTVSSMRNNGVAESELVDNQLTKDAFFQKKGVTKEDYNRMMELLVESSIEAEEDYKRDMQRIKGLNQSELSSFSSTMSAYSDY